MYFGGGLPYLLQSDAVGGADLGQFGALRSSLGSVLSHFLLLGAVLELFRGVFVQSDAVLEQLAALRSSLGVSPVRFAALRIILLRFRWRLCPAFCFGGVGKGVGGQSWGHWGTLLSLFQLPSAVPGTPLRLRPPPAPLGGRPFAIRMALAVGRRIHSDDTPQKPFPFPLTPRPHIPTHVQGVGEHPRHPHPADVAVIRRGHHGLQGVESDLQLGPQLPGGDPGVLTDQLLQPPLVAWRYGRAGPAGARFVLHVAVAAAETADPTPHRAHIHRLIAVDVQQTSVDVDGGDFLGVEEFDHAPLLRPHLDVGRRFVRCHLAEGKETEGEVFN